MDQRRRGVIEQYDALAASFQKLGLIGIWTRKPCFDGRAVKEILPHIPRGPVFRDIMNAQNEWMTTHPHGDPGELEEYLKGRFSEFR